MGQRKIIETIKEYDDKGNLIREQTTETTEDYEEKSYPNHLYSPYNYPNHFYNPYSYPYTITNECNSIKNKYSQGPTKTCDVMPEY